MKRDDAAKDLNVNGEKYFFTPNPRGNPKVVNSVSREGEMHSRLKIEKSRHLSVKIEFI